MLVNILSIGAELVAFLVMILLARRRIIAWPISLVNQVQWALLGYLTGAIGLILGAVIFAVLAIIGWRNWSKKNG